MLVHGTGIEYMRLLRGTVYDPRLRALTRTQPPYLDYRAYK